MNSRILIEAENTFRKRSTSDLLKSLTIFKLCGYPALIKGSEKMMGALERIGLQKAMEAILKDTIFSQFCGGQVESEVLNRMKSLKEDGINSILDYAVEQDHPSKFSENLMLIERTRLGNLSEKLKGSIKLAAANSDNCVAIKLSSIFIPQILEIFSEFLEQKEMTNDWFFEQTSHPSLISHDFLAQYGIDPSKFLIFFNEAYFKLNEIIQLALKNNVRVLIDAEQSYFQPSIDYIANNLMLKYNCENPLVSNTYQMYLKNGLSKLQNDKNAASRMGYHFGVKLVRGAYANIEKTRALSKGYEYPINNSIEETHKQYNDAISLFSASRNLKYYLILATHNEQSILHALNIFPDKSRIAFAQLLGMSDSLTHSLANIPVATFKYVPYGKVSEVIPYLLRRAIENSNAMSNSSHDIHIISRILRERLPFCKYNLGK